jgi:hypothetical protein
MKSFDGYVGVCKDCSSKSLNKSRLSKRICPEDKVVNPLTNRLVLKTSDIGKCLNYGESTYLAHGQLVGILPGP